MNSNTTSSQPRLVRILLPILIILGALIITRVMIASREEPQRRQPPQPTPLVEVVEVHPRDYQIQLKTRGVIEARTSGNLLPQVAGDIVETGPNFRSGGFFEKGELLLRIDPRDYETSVTIAKADLGQAQILLNEEQARASQAVQNLERLQLDRKPSDLALRKPQLAAAAAALASAQARLAQAQLNLERTEIRAPYTGRVLEQNVDIGQYVSPGTVLGRVYAIDYVEVRLPITNSQLAQIELPAAYRDQTAEAEDGPAVSLSAVIGNEKHSWQGQVLRTEGTIDRASRQTFLIAQVDDPYASNDEGRPPLQVGQFVEAKIDGRQFNQVYVIPRAALSIGDLLYAVNAENQLRQITPEIVWRDEEHAIVRSGVEADLRPGARIVTSPLPLANDGMSVRIAGNTAIDAASDAAAERKTERGRKSAQSKTKATKANQE